MKKFIRYLLLPIAILLAYVFPAHAQSDVLSTAVFNPDFRTLKVVNPDNFMAIPVIRLNSDDHLLFSFDELADDYSLLEYRILHCNADWTRSSLADAEFLPRFNSAKIDDYGFSSNTFVHYVNYHITIPNDEITPLVSGNYILQVYPESDPDDIILQARFCVSENSAAVTGSASGRTDRVTNDNLQQIEFSVSTPTMQIRDPYTELFVIVEQNSDPNSTRIIRNPLRVSGDKIVYEHNPQLIFPAGNEFRRFETVRLNYPGLNVDSVRFGDNNYIAYVTPSVQRASRQYLFDSTQKGRFIVREANATDSDLGADYVTVCFALNSDQYTNADVYVQGEFSNYSFSDRYKMRYNSAKHRYELEIPLKQGSYNYRFVALPHGQSTFAGFNPIEGDFYETLNEYTVKIFYKTPGARTDRLIAVSSFVAQP